MILLIELTVLFVVSNIDSKIWSFSPTETPVSDFECVSVLNIGNMI